MNVTIRAFGIAKEIFASSEIEIEVPELITVAGLKEYLRINYPPLDSLKSFVLAVNNSYVNETQLIQELDEIAVIPPVSGG